MSRQKKPRNKKYRPRELMTNTIEWARAGVLTFPHETVDQLMVEPLAAFDKLRRAAADRDDWNMVCQALNIAEALTNQDIGPNLRPQIAAGQEALHAIAQRMLGTGSSTCYAAELAAIDEALLMYKAQVRLCTQGEFTRAFRQVENWHKCGKMLDVQATYYALDKAAA
jgi:hypothetical protein